MESFLGRALDLSLVSMTQTIGLSMGIAVLDFWEEVVDGSSDALMFFEPTLPIHNSRMRNAVLPGNFPDS
jgi:hypothetical protein